MTNPPLKAMFWKECRENLRWAVLAMLALTLGLLYAWDHLLQQNSYPALSQVWTSENLVLTISMPLIGLTLGLLQILPELRRDQWAFLVHRPASRTTLFFGKVLPGVCLYLLATILPLLGLAAWASQPTHVPAPFDFRFTLAGWAAILAGLPFYFAGLLVALRPARWYGSRALPVLTAILAPLAASTFNLFWPVVLVSVFISAVLLCAAWGSFVTSGEYRAQAKPARFALGLALYPACVCVGIGVLVLSFAAYSAFTHSGGEGWRNEQMIDTQGHVYAHDEHFDKQGHDTITVTDENGRPVDPRVWDHLSSSHKLLTLNYLYAGGFSQRYFRYFDTESYAPLLTSPDTDRYQTYWYYEPASHQVVSYKVLEEFGGSDPPRVPPTINYLGPDGFGPTRQQAGQFSGDQPGETEFAGLYLLIFPHEIYCCDLDASVPSVHLLQTLPGGSAGTTVLTQTEDGFVTNGGDEVTAQILIVTAGAQITAYSSLMDKRTKMPTRLFMVTAPTGSRTYSEVQVAVVPDHSRFFFWYQSPKTAGGDRLVTVASSGSIISNRALPPVKDNHSAYKMRFRDAAPALMLPPDGLCAAAFYGYIGDRLHWESASGLWDTTVEGAGPILFFSALGGFASGVLAWLISRRCGDNRREQLALALGGFWLGGYGVLLLLALRAWPARVPCPDCGRLRVVDNDFCEQCRAGWTRPKRDGTEIFDAVSREAAAR